MSDDNKIIIGLDQAINGDFAAVSVVSRREGFVNICTVPSALGPVIEFIERNGRLTAKTASGVEMIIPAPPHEHETAE